MELGRGRDRGGREGAAAKGRSSGTCRRGPHADIGGVSGGCLPGGLTDPDAGEGVRGRCGESSRTRLLALRPGGASWRKRASREDAEATLGGLDRWPEARSQTRRFSGLFLSADSTAGHVLGVKIN